MDKVSLNGVEIFPFDSEQQLLHYVDTHKGMLIAINAEKILHATEQTRVIINRNIGYCDGAGAQMALKQKGYKGACKMAKNYYSLLQGKNILSSWWKAANHK